MRKAKNAWPMLPIRLGFSRVLSCVFVSAALFDVDTFRYRQICAETGLWINRS